MDRMRARGTDFCQLSLGPEPNVPHHTMSASGPFGDRRRHSPNTLYDFSHLPAVIHLPAVCVTRGGHDKGEFAI
uniref:Uncharacterized protein n=1 Tax=Ascaris lumbricoides TaxID=6252 RepID=A0A0M3I484_ASCLU